MMNNFDDEGSHSCDRLVRPKTYAVIRGDNRVGD